MCMYVYFGEEGGRDLIWIGIEITRLSFSGSLFLQVQALFCLYQNHLGTRVVEIGSTGPSLRSPPSLSGKGPREYAL